MSRLRVATALVCGVVLAGGCASNRDGALDRCQQLGRVEGLPDDSVPKSREACLEYLDGRDDDARP